VKPASSETPDAAGLIQRSQRKPGRLKCDIHLQDLATGKLQAISEDRGREARRCVLNTDQLLRVLCKFGRTEAQGGGFRGLIAKAIELSTTDLPRHSLVDAPTMDAVQCVPVMLTATSPVKL
jgi:hypothetical protein